MGPTGLLQDAASALCPDIPGQETASGRNLSGTANHHPSIVEQYQLHLADTKSEKVLVDEHLPCRTESFSQLQQRWGRHRRIPNLHGVLTTKANHFSYRFSPQEIKIPFAGRASIDHSLQRRPREDILPKVEHH